MTHINPIIALKKAFGEDLVAKIQSSKILVVGSGGIGCELLKDLALSGFPHVEVIDLDTIDVSNLNRQLLFRAPHVGQAKCTVACQVAQSMATPPGPAPDGSELRKPNYVSHHGNVCDTSKFNVPFVKAFDLVLNALDNVEARRRVNRLCLAAGTPLIEAGTTGYLGQVTVIHKPSKIACYECVTQETQKVYPICTIRSTPSMPVHTIVWAKEFYKLMFHPKVEESMLFEDTSGDEPSTYMADIGKLRELIGGNGSSDDAVFMSTVESVLVALYKTEIEKQLSMDKYKTAKKTPSPLSTESIEKNINANGNDDIGTGSDDSQEVWSVERSLRELSACFLEARKKKDDEILEEFDKDDDLAMRFVCASANLRSFVFGIEPLQSLYSAKGIAGNIIPAIATTNAICAGLQILQVYKVLKAQLKQQPKFDNSTLDLSNTCRYVNCTRMFSRNGLTLMASTLEPPNPKCFVCRNANVPVTLDLRQWTLNSFLEKIVKARLGFECPTIMLEGDIIWEEGEDSDQAIFEKNLPKRIQDLPNGGMQNGTIVEIEDFTQDLTVEICLQHQETWEDGDTSAEDFPFTVGGEVPQATKEAKQPVAAAAATGNVDDTPRTNDDSDDEIVILSDAALDLDMKPPAKRTAGLNGDAPSPASKKAKLAQEVIEIE